MPRALRPLTPLACALVVLALLASNLLLWRQVTRQQPGARPQTLQVVNLANTEVAPEATGMIIISLDGEHGTLVVDRLPVLSEEQQYQLWLIRDGVRTSGGIFSVEDTTTVPEDAFGNALRVSRSSSERIVSAPESGISGLLASPILAVHETAPPLWAMP